MFPLNALYIYIILRIVGHKNISASIFYC